MCNKAFKRNPSPNRSKSKDNPYRIFTVGPPNDLHYYLSFVDGRGVGICMEINEQLYAAFDQFERDDMSAINEYTRHHEHSVLTEITLNKRAIRKLDPLEDVVEQKIQVERALDTLTQTQRRRLCLYHFYGFTYEEIAAMERSSVKQIYKSIKLAEKKIKNFLSEG